MIGEDILHFVYQFLYLQNFSSQLADFGELGCMVVL